MIEPTISTRIVLKWYPQLNFMPIFKEFNNQKIILELKSCP